MIIDEAYLLARKAELKAQEDKVKSDFSAIRGAMQLIEIQLKHLAIEVKEVEGK